MLVAVLLLGMAATVRADDYADVTQLLRGGKLPEAQARADQYLAGKPRDPQMRFLKGVIQTEAGKLADAVATFTALTQEFPELPEPYNNLAVLYANQKQFDKARTALEMAIRTNPSYATAHENLGDVYAKLASQAYTKALQLDTGNAAVPPKLALIRELFAPAAAAGAAISRGPAVAAPTVTAALGSTSASVVAPAASAGSASPIATGGATSAASTSSAVPAKPVARSASSVPAEADDAAAREVEAAIRAWAAAWAAKDMKGYLSAYGRDFDPPGAQPRTAWEEERRARIVGKSRISVALGEVDVRLQGAGKAVARFRQDYSADALKVSSRKTLELVRADNAWRIVRESTG